MPTFGPLKRRMLIRYLRQLGFEGPYSGGYHQYMVKGSLRLVIPNPHRGDISHVLLARFYSKPALSGSNGNGYEEAVAARNSAPRLTRTALG